MKSVNLVSLGRARVLPTAVIALIAALAAATTTWLVTFSQEQKYWVLVEDAPLGAQLSKLDLAQVSANLLTNQAGYLTTAKRPDGFLTRSVQAGELLSDSAITSEPIGSFARVVIPSSSSLPSTVVSGADVQIWVASRVGADFDVAAQLLQSAQVVRAVESDGIFKSQQQLVEVQVVAETLPALLDALASDSAIYLVPNS